MKKSREKLRAEFLVEAEELFDELMAWDEATQAPDLTQIEDIVLKLRKQFGERLAQKVLEQQEQRQPAEKVICPNCQTEMVPKGAKRHQVESRIGNLPVERAYYHCPQCKQGLFPPGSTTEDLGEAVE